MISRNCNGVAKLVVGQLKGRRTPRVLMAMAVAAVGWMGTHSAKADATWIGGSAIDGNWNDAANWLGGVPPGITVGIGSDDTAWFNAPIANTWGNSAVNPVVIDSTTQNIFGISFDTAADNYFIGSTTGNPLLLTSFGTIQILGSLTSTNATETINAPLAIQGTTYTFANNSASGVGAGSGKLNIGGTITGDGVTTATVLTLSGTNTNANTISGNINNNGVTILSVTASGTGNWVLSGANTYTGVTAISNGTLTVSAIADSGVSNIGFDSATGGALSITGGGTLAYTGAGGSITTRGVTWNGASTINVASGSLTLAGSIISNATAVNKTGTGTLVLGNNNVILDSNLLVNVQQGTLLLNHNNTQAGTNPAIDGTTDIGLGALVQITGTGGNQIWDANATRGITINSGGTFDLNGQSETVALIAGTNGIITNSLAATTSTLTIGQTNGVSNYSGVLQDGAGTLALTKTGTGLATLGGVNTYSGLTTLNGGTLSLASAGALGNTTSIKFTGGTLQYTASNIIDYNNIIKNSSSAVSIDTNSQTVSFINPIDSSNTGGFTKVGAGQLNLTVPNAYTGRTTLAGGTLSLASAGALSTTNNMRFSGGTLQYTSVNTTDYSSIITNSGSAISIDTNGQTIVFASTLDATNTGGLTKLGAGPLTLSASNAFSGTTSANVGTLIIGNANALGVTRLNVAAGATVDLNGNNLNVAFINNGAALAGGVIDNVSAGGNVTLTVGSGVGGVTAASTTYTNIDSYSGLIQNTTGTVSLTKVSPALSNQNAGVMATATLLNGGDVLRLTNQNTYSGATTIKGGIIELNFGNANNGGAAVLTNIISPNSNLVLNGGDLIADGGGTVTQTFAGVTVGAGASHIGAYRNSGGASTFSLKNITRLAGGTLDFQSRPNAGSSSNQHLGAADGTDNSTTANANFTGGSATILGGYATFNGTTWATSASNGTTSAAITGLATFNAGFTAGTNVDAAIGTATPAAMTINSLRFNTAGAYTVNTAGNLNVATGGILETVTVGANAAAINNNSITSGNGQDLIVIQNNGSAAGILTIGSNITGAIGLTKSGIGALTLTPNTANTFSGPLTINAGTVTLGNANALASATNATAPVDVVFSGTSQTQTANTYLFTNGTLSLGGNSVTIASLTSSSISSGTAIVQNLNATTTATLTINGSTSTQFDGLLQNGTSSAAFGLAKLGTSTLTLTNANTYTGGTQVGGGIINATSNAALGASTSALLFNPTVSAVVNFTSAAPAIGSLASNGAGTSGIVLGNTTGIPSATALTIGANNTSTTFGGVISDLSVTNATAVGSITKTGTGSLTFSGPNVYTGNTAVNNGTLVVANATGSATGAGNVTIAAAGTLSGSGTIGGNLTSSGMITPGTVTAGLAGSGKLTVGSGALGGNVTLNSNSVVNFGLDASNPNNDQVSALGMLTLPSTGTVTLNLFTPNTSTPFSAAGSYNLFQYGTLVDPNALTSEFVIGTGLAGVNSNFTAAGGFLTLILTSTGTSATWTNGDLTGTWNDANNWSPHSIPQHAGDSANFGATAPGTVTLDANETVGSVVFNNATAAFTIVGSSALTIDNSGSGGFITDGAGTHALNTAVSLNDNVSVNVSAAGDTLTLGGVISNASVPKTLTKAGLGTLVMSGTGNSYGPAVAGTVGTNLNLGKLQVTTSSALGVGDVAVNGTSTLQAGAANLSVANNIILGSALTETIDTMGNVFTLSGVISGPATSGLLAVTSSTGNGTLVLIGSNTYTGATALSSGKLSISANANLGAPGTGASLSLAGGTTLISTATFALDNAGANSRAVTIGSGGASVDVAPGTTLTVSGLISGSALTLVDSGTLAISNNGNTAPFIVSNGTLTGALTTANTSGGFGSGNITLQGGATINALMGANNSLGFANALNVPLGQTGTLDMTNRFAMTGNITGGGTLNVVVNTNVTRDDFSNNWTGFTGALNLSGAGGVRLIINGGGFGAGIPGAAVDLEGTVNLVPSTNSTGNTISFGALSGTSGTTVLAGGTAGGPTWSIGALNTSTTFAGTIQGNGLLTKVGTGALTLAGPNSYTGTTTVTGGALIIGDPTVNGGTTGSLGTAAVVNNASLIFNRSDAFPDSFLVSNNISGSGTITQAGIGVTSLSGSNTYSGATTISAGKLSLENTSGSATGTSAVAVNNTGTLGGNGSTTSAVTVASGGAIAPGVFGVGTLTVGSLTLNSGSILKYEFQGFSSPNDLTVTTAANGLTINGAGIDLYQPGGTTTYSNTGIYNILAFNGTLGGAGTTGLSVLNPDPTKSYSFISAGGFVSVLITDGGTGSNYWALNNDSNWNNTGNWTLNTVPNGQHQFAGFGGGGLPITGPHIVTLDIAATVGTLAFNSGSQFTITGSNTLTLDAGGDGAAINDINGSHIVQVPVFMNSSTVINVQNATDTLTMSGIISDNFVTAVEKVGAGTLVLSVANTYSTSNNIVNGGTVLLTGAGTLGSQFNNLQMNFGTLDLGITTQTVATVNISGGDILHGTLVSNSVNFIGSGTSTISASLSAPTFVTVGLNGSAGKLILSGANTYDASTTINSGTLQISAANNLGDGSTSNSISMNGGTLESSGNSYDLGVNRQISINSAAKIQTDAGTLTISGPVFVNGLLTVQGAANTSITGNINGGAGITMAGGGVLTLSGQNGYSGATTVNSGTLSVSNVNDDGTGNIGFGSSTPGLLVVNSGGTFTYTGAATSTTLRGITLNGGAIINVSSATGVLAFTGAVVGNAAAFTKTGPGTLVLGDNIAAVVDANLEVLVQQGVLELNHNNAAEGNTDTTVDAITDIDAGALVKIMNTSGNQIYGGNATRGVTINSGGTLDLNGASEMIAFLAGTNGIVTNSAPATTSLLSLGQTNATSNTYSGVLQDGAGAGKLAITKIGTGTQTLSGTNAYTGATTVAPTSGTLLFGIGPALPITSSLTIGAASTAGMPTNAGTRDTINNVLRISNLNIAGAVTGGAITPTATLALANNDAIISSGAGIGYSAAEVAQLIKLGQTSAFGITRTAAASRGLGYVTADEYHLIHGPAALFDGVAVNSGVDTLVKYTYLGDATMDGKISVADYAQIDTQFLFGTGTIDWFNGDFNYDGVVNYQDYALIDAAFLAQSGALAQGEIDSHAAEFGAPYLAALDTAINGSAVPEPASLGILALGAFCLMARRRR